MNFFRDWHHFRELPETFFLLGIALLLLGRPMLVRLSPLRQSTLLQRVALYAGLLTITVYVALCLCSLRSFMIDVDEANILSIAAASMHGQPVYPSLHSPDVSYSNMYGPLTFLVYRTAMVLGQGAFWPFRLSVVAANLCFCLVLFSTLRKVVRWQTAAALLAFPLCLMLHYIFHGLGLRPDIWMVLSVALAVRCALLESPLLAVLLTGVFAGMAIDFKLPAVLAFPLLLLLLFRRFGAKAAVLAGTIAAATALAPFCLHNFSLPNYLSWVIQSGSVGLAPDVTLFCFLYAGFLLLPLLTLRLLGFPPWPKLASATYLDSLPLEPVLFLLCLLGAAFVSSKVAAGPYHLWQLLPIVTLYVGAAIAAGRQQGPDSCLRLDYVICLVAVSSTLFGLSFIERDIHGLKVPTTAQAAQLRLARQELQEDLDLYHGQTLQVGYGPSPGEMVEMLRYLPVFHDQPYTLDEPGWYEAWTLPFPANIPVRMVNCTNDVWLIPHGERPFDQYFHFPPTLHETFIQHYAVQRQGQIYDAWVCKAAKR